MIKPCLTHFCGKQRQTWLLVDKLSTTMFICSLTFHRVHFFFTRLMHQTLFQQNQHWINHQKVSFDPVYYCLVLSFVYYRNFTSIQFYTQCLICCLMSTIIKVAYLLAGVFEFWNSCCTKSDPICGPNMLYQNDMHMLDPNKR